MSNIYHFVFSLIAKYKPAVTFVVVKKRHNTRFFPMDKQNSDRSGNCESGTVVDTMISHPTEFDFCKPSSFCICEYWFLYSYWIAFNKINLLMSLLH